jgi:DNA-directed RNA polymerase specialized sigma24 family protein
VKNNSTEPANSALSELAFNRFLACLDHDRERAGLRYEALRAALMRLFDWRGAFDPATCADETINRVIRKIGAGETIRDIPTYCQGVARLVLLETLRQQNQRQVSLDDVPAHQLTPLALIDDEDNARQDCFQKCLRSLPNDSRALILQYYQDEGRAKINHRARLADELGIPLNALRNRVQRIRARLEDCVQNCLKRR